MFGLLLLYFIGEKFYKLAVSFDKNKWGYTILGIVAYYFGTFVFGLLFWIAMDLWGNTPMEETSELDSTAINIVAIPFGLLSCYGLYTILKKNWDKNSVEDPNVLDNMDI